MTVSARPTGAMNLVGGQVDHAFPPVGASQAILVGDLLCDAGLLAGSTATGVAAPASTLPTQATANALQKLVHDSFFGISETYRDAAVTTTGTVRDFASVATTGTAKLSFGATNSTAYNTGAFIGAYPSGSSSTWVATVDSNGITTVAPAASAEYAIGIVASPVATTDQTVNVKFLGTLTTAVQGVQNKASA